MHRQCHTRSTVYRRKRLAGKTHKYHNPSLHLLHPKLAAADRASRACWGGAATSFVSVSGGDCNRTYRYVTVFSQFRLRVLFQKHVLPRLARMLPRPLLNEKFHHIHASYPRVLHRLPQEAQLLPQVVDYPIFTREHLFTNCAVRNQFQRIGFKFKVLEVFFARIF